MAIHWIDMAIIVIYLVGITAVGIWFSRHQRESSTGYFLAGRSLGWVTVGLALFATNLLRGGDAKLLLSVLAWQPAIDTWTITLACLALIGGAVVVWSCLQRRNRQENSLRRYPLGGVIAIAGLIVLWTR